jgi:hypothetical protein
MSANPVASQRQSNGTWVPVVPSPNNTVVNVGSTGKIIDNAGNVWTLPSTGVASVNGVPDTSTWGVVALSFVNDTVYQFNGTDYYSKSVPLWTNEGTVNPTNTGTATLSWKAPTTNTDGSPAAITGYTILYGSAVVDMTNKVILAASVTSYTLTLAAGTWFFAVEAENSFNVVSAESNVVSKVIT